MASDESRRLFLEQIQKICDQLGVSKSEAFTRWICQNILGITDEVTIDEAVSIDGKNDYGIDIFHAEDKGDDAEQYICWIQAKFSDNLNHVITRGEMESFASTVGYLKDCPTPANMVFKQKSAEFVKITKQHPRMRKEMLFVVTGNANEQVKNMISDDEWIKDKFGNNGIKFGILDLDEILSRVITSHTPKLPLKFDGKAIIRKEITTNKKSVIGYMAAKDLVSIAKKYRGIMFLENPRETLGKTAPTYNAIKDTLENSEMKKKFWKLNNGITAICTGFNVAYDDKTFIVDNFKVVNGRQTIYTLANNTHLIDGVFLLVILHEAVDNNERNLISKATNTQNPIKPADLVTNYPSMIDLMMQCKDKFNDFYFERQTKGFNAAAKHIQYRVTRRRVLEKDSSARAYCAYAIDPNKAMMSKRDLFFVTGDDSYYNKIFKGRKIEELIIPHIYMEMLNALYRKWSNSLTDDPAEETSRKKGIISKNIVKYYILKFIYESMMNIDEKKRKSIEKKMIEKFRKLKQKESMPEEFLNIAELAYDRFMHNFDRKKEETWPEEIIKRIEREGYEKNDQDKPSPYDIMYVLKRKGDTLLQSLLDDRKVMINKLGDKVQEKILELDSKTDNE